MMGKNYVPSVREHPTVTREFYEKAAEAFKYRMPHPEMSIEEIMFEAGKQEVLEYLRRNIRNVSSAINREIL